MRISVSCAATAVAAFFMTAPAVHVVDDPVAKGTDRCELTAREVVALYENIKGWMAESCTRERDEV